jgi:hypothetical protein
MQTRLSPDWLGPYLLPGEAVLACLHSMAEDYYATDRRLLRFKSREVGEGIPYERVTITRQSIGLFMNAMRLILLLLSLLLVALGLVFGLLRPVLHAGPTVFNMAMPNDVMAIFLGCGVACLLFSFLLVGYTYEVAVYDTPDKPPRRWRLPLARVASGETHQFARVLKEKTDAARLNR